MEDLKTPGLNFGVATIGCTHQSRASQWQQGTLAVSGDILGYHSWGAATGIWWLEARGAVLLNILQCTGKPPHQWCQDRENLLWGGSVWLRSPAGWLLASGRIPVPEIGYELLGLFSPFAQS